MNWQSNPYSDESKEIMLAGRGWTVERFLAKNLPSLSLHKGCVWAHESRAIFGHAVILNT